MKTSKSNLGTQGDHSLSAFYSGYSRSDQHLGKDGHHIVELQSITWF